MKGYIVSQLHSGRNKGGSTSNHVTYCTWVRCSEWTSWQSSCMLTSSTLGGKLEKVIWGSSLPPHAFVQVTNEFKASIFIFEARTSTIPPLLALICQLPTMPHPTSLSALLPIPNCPFSCFLSHTYVQVSRFISFIPFFTVVNDDLNLQTYAILSCFISSLDLLCLGLSSQSVLVYHL